MRLICAYVAPDRVRPPGKGPGLQPETERWALTHGFEMHDVSGSDIAYWSLLCELWRGGESFILMEDDMLPTEAAYRSLRYCRLRDWCVCPYRVNGMADGALGFARYSAALIRRYPDAMDGIPPDKRWWLTLDGNVTVSLVQRLRHPGPHIHRRHEVEHLHKYGR